MNEPEASVLSPLQKRAEQDPQFAEEMWRYRFPEEGGEKMTLTAILADALPRYGVECSSPDTLRRFYLWLKVRRDFAAKRDAISQIQAEMAKDPAISPEQIEKAGRVMFLTDSYVDKNAKVFASMVKIGQNDKALDQRDKQLKQRDKELTQREKLVEQSERRVAILEARAKAADAAAEQLALLKAGGKMMPEDQRTAILDKMDEILGLKK
jgi:hypothetical protein